MFDKLKNKIEDKIEKECQPLIYNPSDGYTYSDYREIMIENHRRLWKWIMWRTIIERSKQEKYNYFTHYDIDNIKENCFLCEYVAQEKLGMCINCPVRWRICGKRNSLYRKWFRCFNTEWIKSAYYAWRISRVREKKEK